MLRRILPLLSVGTLVLACGDDTSVTTETTASTGEPDPGTTSSESATTSPDPTTGTATEMGSGGETTDPSTGGDSTGADSTGPGVVCGDDVAEGDEACDGSDLLGLDCVSEGFDEGTLVCAEDCTALDTSGCVSFNCGDGVVAGTEVCDGNDLGGATCISEGFDSGTLACTLDCSALDTDGCGTCGNVIIDGDEVCDDIALLGETCVTQGFGNGQLGCQSDCMGFDTATCGECGNDLVDGDEVCDGADLLGEDCVSQGFAAGDLACEADCYAYLLDGCTSCGDGVVNGTDSCDGMDLAGNSCMSLGLGMGNLGCLPNCIYDFSDCDIPGGSEVHDFPIAADPRFTLAGNLFWNAGDWVEGVRNTMLPSIGSIDIHLEIINNGLSPCGFQEAEVSVNGTPLGTFTVVMGTTAIDQSFPIMPSIPGPVYTVRYETVATVAPGCGAAGYSDVGSTVTFNAG